MRTESYWTRRVMAHLTKNHKDWLAYKFADQFTGGIPDLVVIANKQSWWFELKVLRPNQTISDRINMKSDRHAKLQLHDMAKIQRLGCPAYYLFFFPTDNLHFFILQAAIVDRFCKGASQPLFQTLFHMSVNDFNYVTRAISGEEYLALQL